MFAVFEKQKKIYKFYDSNKRITCLNSYFKLMIYQKIKTNAKLFNEYKKVKCPHRFLSPHFIMSDVG